MKLNKGVLLSAPALFIYYLLGSSLVILGFRFFVPGQEVPLSIFSRKWRLILGGLEVLALFPALAYSGLAFPFSVHISRDEYQRFSPRFLERFRGPVITALFAAIVYALLYFLVQPLVQEQRIDMSYRGTLYRFARDSAEDRAARGLWDEAAYFLGLAGQIWPDSPELARLRDNVEIELEEERIRQEDERQLAQEDLAEGWRIRDSFAPGFPDRSAMPGQRQPLDTREALDMAAAAMRDERYYDAHWLATLGTRLARAGSPEEASASRAVSLAWDALTSMAPNTREQGLYARYHLKQSGYQALVAGDWIRAYYTFRELIEQTPNDPEAWNFFRKSEDGIRDIAFFTDEMSRGMGNVLTNAMFSLPCHPRSGGVGRGILRFTSISLYQDYAYGFGLEFICFDSANRPESRFQAPYAKILPMTLGGRPGVAILMQALDRDYRDRRWGPVWSSLEDAAAAGRPTVTAGAAGGFLHPVIGDNQIMLDLSFENFILLCYAWRGLGAPGGSAAGPSPLDGFSLGDLFAGARSLGSYGYIPQIFEAEIIYQLNEPLFFLPLAVSALIVGWRFRALSRPRYIFIPMLFVLPLVFNGLVFMYRHMLNTVGVFSILNWGFSATLAFSCLGAGILFVLALIAFVYQRS